jgi:hypothetical protein
MDSVSANKPFNEDPLYSTINTWDTTGHAEPPKLPPNRVPYYQEIESDGATPPAAKTSPRYETLPPHPGYTEDFGEGNEINYYRVTVYLLPPLRHYVHICTHAHTARTHTHTQTGMPQQWNHTRNP